MEGPPHHLRHRVRLGAIACAAGLLAVACTSSSTTSTNAGSSGSCSSSTSSPAPGGTLGGDCDTRTPTLKLTGAGANSIQPFYERAFYYYNQANKGVSVDYSPVGSSVGITDVQQNTVQFGQSEVPMPSPATGTAGTILQVPVDLGGVALSYNIPGVDTGLKLDGPTLAGIYTGAVTNWDDQAIAALNTGVKLPHLAIVAVHRADSSGPGYDLDQYLLTTGGTAWTSKAGTKAATRWPIASIGVGQQLNTGVASYIQQTQGAIGYVEYAFAQKSKFNNVALKNASGAFVAPTLDSIKAAGAQATNLSAANFNIVNGGGAATYPLANFSWALLYQKQASTNVGIVLGKLFDWVTTTGQQQAAPLGYAPMPDNAVTLAHTTLLTLQTASGQPLFS
ncbi:MAG: phosphate transporter, periplasmic phosphate-binding protein [Actinobacteria bacterium]|nr:phosphate transporter, periplasmic phosphate-binding protein [Actinomycetota bacterium]